MRILAYIVFGVLFFHLVGFVRDRFTVTQAATGARCHEGTEYTRVEHRDGSIEFSPVYLDGLLVRCRTSAR